MDTDTYTPGQHVYHGSRAAVIVRILDFTTDGSGYVPESSNPDAVATLAPRGVRLDSLSGKKDPRTWIAYLDKLRPADL